MPEQIFAKAPRTNFNPTATQAKVLTFTEVAKKDVTFDYEPLNAILTKEAFVYTGIPMPDLQRSQIIEVHHIQASGPLYFHNNDLTSLVHFRIEGHPNDNNEGKSAITEGAKLVQEVLKKEYKPAVATIVHLAKDGKTRLEERQIHDCIITGMELDLGKKESIKLVFHLLGLLHRPY